MKNPTNQYTKEDHQAFMNQLTKSYPEHDSELRAMTLKWADAVLKKLCQ